MDLLSQRLARHETHNLSGPIILLFVLINILLLIGHGYAQLSPGPLHRSHSFLEGVQNCQKCHDPDKNLAPAKCLACHKEMKKRIDNRLGLHGKQEYLECSTCHVEHQGLDVDLVYWKDGVQNFDHALSGYVLQGKHATAKCRDCHLPRNVVDRAELAQAGKDLSRTFLGLDQNCLSCHQDEHRKQLAAACTNCHGLTTWKPTISFDHSKTKYVLTGKHLQAACDKCHHVTADSSIANETGYVQYIGMKFATCLDCHKDAHDGRLGANCEKCHNPDGWGVAKLATFDHQQTRFPLLGMHTQVTCDKCHKKGEPVKGLKFAKCRDCHEDYHLGEFADRPAGGACEECHTVNSYKLTTYTVELHQQTKYPLAGSHLAVSCDLCHGKAAVPRALAAGKRFTFISTRCQDCHPDSHGGTLDKYVTVDGCEICHDVAGWHKVKFDHSKTKFALQGKHVSVSCRDCHGGKDKKATIDQLKFVGVSRKCEDCHKDNHRGQFAQVAATDDLTGSNCTRCHTPSNWKAERFDHNRDATFKLDGAHQRVACSGCHKARLDAGTEFVLYKPLASTCKSCHSGSSPETKEKES
jgi:hypothetical protein